MPHSACEKDSNSAIQGVELADEDCASYRTPSATPKFAEKRSRQHQARIGYKCNTCKLVNQPFSHPANLSFPEVFLQPFVQVLPPLE